MLFCDTNVLATELWRVRLFGRASPRVVALAAETAGDYITFLCEPDFVFEQDGTREDRAAQLEFHGLVRADLERRGIAFRTLRGPLESRIAAVEEALAGVTSRSLAPRTRS